MPEFRGYERVINEATGVTDPETLAEIEDLMRNVIFHSTLDWQTREQLHQGAREAHQLMKVMKV
jgi:hypothetical protein